MPPLPPNPPTTTVLEVTRGPGGIVYVGVRLPNGERRRICMPEDLATTGNIQISAAAMEMIDRIQAT